MKNTSFLYVSMKHSWCRKLTPLLSSKLASVGFEHVNTHQIFIVDVVAFELAVGVKWVGEPRYSPPPPKEHTVKF